MRYASLMALVALGLSLRTLPASAQISAPLTPSHIEDVFVGRPYEVVAAHGSAGVTGFRLFIDGIQQGPDLPPSASLHGVVRTAAVIKGVGRHVVTLVAFNATGETSSAPIIVRAWPTTCPYDKTLDGMPADPKVEKRPLNYPLDGLNTLPQAARIAQLEAWGWEIRLPGVLPVPATAKEPATVKPMLIAICRPGGLRS